MENLAVNEEEKSPILTNIEKEVTKNENSQEFVLSLCQSCLVGELEVLKDGTENQNFDNKLAEAGANSQVESIDHIEATNSLSKISLLDETIEENGDEIVDDGKATDVAVEPKEKQLETEVDKTETVEPKEKQLEKEKDKSTDAAMEPKEKELEKEVEEDDDKWGDDEEFPNSEELNRIDSAIQQSLLSHQNFNGNIIINKVNNNTDINSVLAKGKHIAKPDASAIKSSTLNRKQILGRLSDNLYKFSTYLDDIRKAVTAKEHQTDVKLPSAPVLGGFNNQFDFPLRYPKLPVQIENVERNHQYNGKIQSHSTQFRSQVVKTVQNPGRKNYTLMTPTGRQSMVKRGLSNAATAAVHDSAPPKKIPRQTTIKEAFKVNKENRKHGTSTLG